MNIFLILFLAGTALGVIADILLETIDFNFRKKHGKKIPEEVRGCLDEATAGKTVLYRNAGYKTGIYEVILSAALTAYLVFSGFYPSIFYTILNQNLSPYVSIPLFFVACEVPAFILGIPFSLYEEFGIEKTFGFSNMTAGMWIADLIKSVIVGLIIFVPLICVFVFIFSHFEVYWWFFLATAYLVFSLGLSVIYPMFIAPLFNKFTPLEEGELKTRLESLLTECGFKASGLYVMDASRRSGHSNAYFTGFGKSKRVVLYDTLISQMTAQEIEAVLAHELGHYKKHHIIKRMLVVVPVIYAVLFAASLVLSTPSLYEAFGFTFSAGKIELMFAGIFLLSLVFGPWGIVLNPVTNYFSRKDEFEADAFSKKLCGTGEHLVSALIKLNRENLSELQVPRIYSLFNYSHPPLL
ncbi:MAG: M48 family metallopeptidase, partial [Treponema sp.]|nr:M48 family metallopeptidase [Treponema sp.]